MICVRCHHTHQAHELNSRSDNLLRVGKCLVPDCGCKKYIDKIEKIDEDLL